MDRVFSGSPYETSIGYARAVVADGFVFVSGTTGLPPDTHSNPPVEAQCDLALSRIVSALDQVGCTLRDVVRVRYILPDASDFEVCWPSLRAAFVDAPPAATMIEAGLIDPRMKIEIEVTARLPRQAG